MANGHKTSRPHRESIFFETRDRQERSQIEFSYFRQRAIEQIHQICGTIDRFDQLRQAFSFWIDSGGGEDHLQINFGTRKMWAKGIDGGTVAEKGASLVYSLNPVDGLIVTVLYPATSDLGSVKEDHIFIRAGNYSGIDLLGKLRSDLKDLVAYVYVSSLELNPTLADRLRFWWLRTTHPHSIDKKFVRPVTPQRLAMSASKFTMMSPAVALLRPIGILLAYLLLGYLGFASMTKYLH